MNRMSIDDAQTVIQSSNNVVESLNQAASMALMRVGREGQEAWLAAVNDKPPGDYNLKAARAILDREGVVQEDGSLMYENDVLTIKSDGYGILVARKLDNRILLSGDGTSLVASVNNLERRDAAALRVALEGSHIISTKDSLPRLRTLAQELGQQTDDLEMTFQSDDYRIVTNGDRVELYRQGHDTPVLSGSVSARILTENKLNDVDRRVLANVPSEEQIIKMRDEILQQKAPESASTATITVASVAAPPTQAQPSAASPSSSPRVAPAAADDDLEL